MLKKLLFIFFIALLSSQGFALVPDSIGVINKGGKSFIKHLVEKGETHFAISRKYGVSVNEIIQANPDTKSGLVAGTIIVIPTKILKGKIHTVQPGETLFSLYRKYGSSVEDIKKWNGLSSNELAVGQKVIVSPGEETEEVKEEKTNEHIVEKGETLFSISRKYNVKWQDIKIYNGLTSNDLNPGQKLGIPSEELNTKHEETEISPEEVSNIPESHIVKAGETMYSIGKKYGLKTQEIIDWNGLLGPEIQLGQELVLHEPKAEENPVEKDPIISTKEEYMKGEPKVRITNVGGHEKIIESGMAQVIEGGSETNRFLGLHKTAPIGTVVQVKNLINDYSVFVRVVGKLPDIDSNNDIVLKITPKAFEALKGVDKKFKVEISWLP